MSFQTFADVDAQLQGRNHASRKLANNTYLQRRDNGAIAVQLHSTDVVTFKPNGDIVLCSGEWDTRITSERMNSFSPLRVWREGGSLCAGHRAATWDEVQKNAVTFERGQVTLTAKGKLQGGSLAALRHSIKEAAKKRARPRSRARYWIRKARGLYVDKSGCTAPAGQRWNCISRSRWERRRAVAGHSFACGCKMVSRPATRGKLTVKTILDEANANVRSAMIHCYGIQEFFLDAKAHTIEERDGYQLLEIRMGVNAWTSDGSVFRAVQMECPSTGEIYINPIPPNISTIPEALNWIFNVPDYLGTVGAQS